VLCRYYIKLTDKLADYSGYCFLSRIVSQLVCRRLAELVLADVKKIGEVVEEPLRIVVE